LITLPFVALGYVGRVYVPDSGGMKDNLVHPGANTKESYIASCAVATSGNKQINNIFLNIPG
jgi:hypothetical protein